MSANVTKLVLNDKNEKTAPATSPELPQSRSDALHRIQTTIAKRAPPKLQGSSTAEPRKRREDPLPFSMQRIDPNDRQCTLCGPPFDTSHSSQLRGQLVCSFECAKRYVAEVLINPHGLNICHGKVIYNHSADGGRSGVFSFPSRSHDRLPKTRSLLRIGKDAIISTQGRYCA